MRLTNTIREAFVRAAMNDVPETDYEEAAQKVAKEALFASLPMAVKKMTRDSTQSQYLNREYITMPTRFSNFHYFCQQHGNSIIRESMPDVWAKILELHAKHEQQIKDRRELQTKLSAVANSVTTRKALVAALPEFEKYLPADEEKAIRTLPVVANVVADFTKAGWPKQKGAAHAS